MGFLAKLFGGGQPETFTLAGNGDFGLEVKGESHYQDALAAICGPRTEKGENRQVEAMLIIDDRNPYDAQAVRVEIGGRLVGHLSREAARAYRTALRQAGHPRAIGRCQAKIRGGWQRKSGGGDRLGAYGVWLDIPVED